MTPDETQIWGRVYAAVIAGLTTNPTVRSTTNPTVRYSWEDMRDRARIEATAAIRILREKPL